MPASLVGFNAILATAISIPAVLIRSNENAGQYMPDYLVFVIIGVVFPLLWAIGSYNSFIKSINMIEESWSSIDVALKRRFNLIPNLINSVKGYSQHEAEVLQSVTDQRVNETNPNTRSKEESAISKSLSDLLAVAEAYPDLKASANFLELQRALNQVEEEIQKSRQFYNTKVRRLNTMVEQFPSNIIAKLFGFKRQDYFTLELATQRELPVVEF